jgi:Ferritin-like domain
VSVSSSNDSITRAQLLNRSARSGAALLAVGTALGALAETAAADPLPLGDLAYARLLLGAELLAADFYSQAIAASNTGATVMKYLKRAYKNEQEHYQSVAGILSGSLNTPAVSGDITFSYPAGTFDSEASILTFAQQLENTVLGAYLGAIGGIQTNGFKTGLAQIAACEAQHCSYFTTVTGGKAFNLSFPPALTIDQASNALDAYTA